MRVDIAGKNCLTLFSKWHRYNTLADLKEQYDDIMMHDAKRVHVMRFKKPYVYSTRNFILYNKS